MCWLARTGGLGVALAALALPGAWAQTQTWAVWSSTFTAGTASGTIGGISYSVAVNPVGTSVGGGLAITSYNAASTWWSNTTVYGPNSPATSRSVNRVNGGGGGGGRHPHCFFFFHVSLFTDVRSY